MSTYAQDEAKAIQWNLKEFQRQLSVMEILTGQTAGYVVWRFARQVVRNSLALTPPCGRGKLMKETALQKVAGEKSVVRDVFKLFPLFDTNKIWAERLRSRVEVLMAEGDLKTVRKILGDTEDFKLLRKPDPDIHQRHRNKFGRVSVGLKRYFIEKDPPRMDYARETAKRVGKGKAGWAAACRALGVAMPTWVRRHAGKMPGGFEKSGGENWKSKPTVTFWNAVPYVQSYADEFSVMRYAFAFSRRMWEKDLQYKMAEIGRGRGRAMKDRAAIEASSYYEKFGTE